MNDPNVTSINPAEFRAGFTGIISAFRPGAGRNRSRVLTSGEPPDQPPNDQHPRPGDAEGQFERSNLTEPAAVKDAGYPGPCWSGANFIRHSIFTGSADASGASTFQYQPDSVAPNSPRMVHVQRTGKLASSGETVFHAGW